jgi:hypothetical protein
VINWQHISILPLFLLVGTPQQLQNYEEFDWRSIKRPSLPENLGDLDETQHNKEMESYHRRLVMYSYIKNTKEYNKLHYAALMDSAGMLRRRLFCQSSEQ